MPSCDHMTIRKCDGDSWRCARPDCEVVWDTYDAWLKAVWEPLAKTHDLAVSMSVKPTPLIEIVSLTKTCDACPAQWDAVDSTGRHLYIRYRWGWLSVKRAPASSPTDAQSPDGEEIVSMNVGGSLDGSMDESELAAATAHVLTFRRST